VLVKRFFFLLNAAIAMAILDLISQVHLPLFVSMLPKYLKRSTFALDIGILNL
jgi:fatty acid/phospholipid biosynthesis enzyme